MARNNGAGLLLILLGNEYSGEGKHTYLQSHRDPAHTHAV